MHVWLQRPFIVDDMAWIINYYRKQPMYLLIHVLISVNILRLRQDGRHFPDDIFKCIFLNENV